MSSIKIIVFNKSLFIVSMKMKFQYQKKFVNEKPIKSSLNSFHVFYLATNQRRISIVSITKDSDDEITTVTDQSNTDFEETVAQ
jgi:hypothetical protein